MLNVKKRLLNMMFGIGTLAVAVTSAFAEPRLVVLGEAAEESTGFSFKRWPEGELFPTTGDEEAHTIRVKFPTGAHESHSANTIIGQENGRIVNISIWPFEKALPLKEAMEHNRKLLLAQGLPKEEVEKHLRGRKARQRTQYFATYLLTPDKRGAILSVHLRSWDINKKDVKPEDATWYAIWTYHSTCTICAVLFD